MIPNVTKTAATQNIRLVLSQLLMWNAGKNTMGESFGGAYESLFLAALSSDRSGFTPIWR